jgi:excisionase family DNA binding protein
MYPLYDVKTAAHFLAVSPWTVRAYIRDGKLRPVRFGRLVRLESEELLRFVAHAKSSAEISQGSDRASPDSQR